MVLPLVVVCGLGFEDQVLGLVLFGFGLAATGLVHIVDERPRLLALSSKIRTPPKPHTAEFSTVNYDFHKNCPFPVATAPQNCIVH